MNRFRLTLDMARQLFYPLNPTRPPATEAFKTITPKSNGTAGTIVTALTSTDGLSLDATRGGAIVGNKSTRTLSVNMDGVQGFPMYASASTLGLGPPAQTATTGTVTANRLYRVPVLNPYRNTFTKIQIQVQTLAAGSHVRVGIYKCGAAGETTTLVVDGGVLDTSTTGVKTATISSVLEAGWHYLAMVSDGAPVLYFYNSPLSIPFFGWDNTGGSAPALYNSSFRAFTYAALPSDETASSYSPSLNTGPFMMIR